MTDKLVYLSGEVKYFDNICIDADLRRDNNGVTRLFGYFEGKTFEQTTMHVDDNFDTEVTWVEMPEKESKLIETMQSEYPDSIFE